MRCLCCNENLSDYESTLRNVATGEFVDICRKCLPGTGINVEAGGSVDDTWSDDEGDDEYVPFVDDYEEYDDN